MKILCYDTGLFVTQAAALAAGGNQVKYVTNWGTRFPKYADYAIGKHMPGLEKEFYFWKWVEWADMIVNFDVNFNDAIEYLRNKYPEKSIIGSGKGCILEDDRIELKWWIDSLGLPIQDYDVVYGVPALREYLKKNKDIYVKLNRFRYDTESFYSKDYESVKLKIDRLSTALGPHADDPNEKTGFPFVCESCIDADVEIGVDIFFNGKNYISPFLYGIEYHKGPYVGIVADMLPEPLQETMDAFEPVLREMKWRGPISTEEKIISEKEHYLLDVCSRLPSPLSCAFPLLIKNWQEALYKIGKGEDVEFDMAAKYVAVCPFTDEDAREGYVKVDLKGENVSALMSCGDENGGIYAVKGLEEVGCAMAIGDSFDEVMEKLHKNCEDISTPGIDKDKLSGMHDKFKELIAAAEKKGIEL